MLKVKLALASAIISASLAFGAYAYEGQPYVTIRFNKQNVEFRNSLYQAVYKAVETRSDVVFDVVGGGDKARVVADSIAGMGVSPSQINLVDEGGSGEGYPVVRVYVR